MNNAPITTLTPDDLLAIAVPPIRGIDPPVVRDWKSVAIRAQQDIRQHGRGDITTSSAVTFLRLAIVALRKEGVTI